MSLFADRVASIGTENAFKVGADLPLRDLLGQFHVDRVGRPLDHLIPHGGSLLGVSLLLKGQSDLFAEDVF